MNILLSNYQLHIKTIVSIIDDISKHLFNNHFFRIDDFNSTILNNYLILLYNCLNPYYEVEYDELVYLIGITNIDENNVIKSSITIELNYNRIKLYITRLLPLVHQEEKDPTFIITLEHDGHVDEKNKLYIINFLLISILLITRLNNNSITNIGRVICYREKYTYRSIDMNNVLLYIIDKLNIRDNNLEYIRLKNIMNHNMIDITLNNFIVKIINNVDNCICYRDF